MLTKTPALLIAAGLCLVACVAHAQAPAEGLAQQRLPAPEPQEFPARAGLWQIEVDQRAMTSGRFQVLCTDHVRAMLGTLSVPPVALQKNRQPLPAWLRFDPRLCKFTAENMPAKALPLSVVIRARQYLVEVVIQREAAE